MRRRLLSLFVPLALVVPLTATSVSAVPTPAVAPTALVAAEPACPPETAPEYAGETPTLQDVLGFDFGSQQVTAGQMNTYLAAVDRARDDVATGTFATSERGRPMRYAVVGDPADVARAQAASAALRDPDTSAARAARIADTAPAIVWMAGNIHGNEESGGDAALLMLYSLADRVDCSAERIRDHQVTVIVPTQNPDGRTLNQRRNVYGFDLNRDWFARTQVETDGKLDLMMEYPPVLLSDNHEMGGTSFFFPPNADPVHHEVADQSIAWINDLYGAAMAAAFDRNGWDYFNYSVYDLLYMGYGDSVPTTTLLGAGMTYEKGGDSPIPERTQEQFVATWASMDALAAAKADVLEGLAANYREAAAEGRAGRLEPNRVFAPGSALERQVPNERVRGYFLREVPAKRAETRTVVRLLQGMGVQVRRLTRSLRVPDYRAYGDAPRRVVLPAGTWYVPMAQGQKHWVQAMLGEDSYVPFPYFYDVTAWSLPLLGNLPAGRTGAALRPASRVAAPVVDPKAPRLPRGAPAVGLWLTDDSTAAYESEGWTRWLFERKWRLPYRHVTTEGISEGALAPLDVLVVPNGDAEATYDALGPQGRSALRTWLADGGRFVGWRGGTRLAALLQLTTARLSAPTSDVPGSLIRVDARRGALSDDVGAQAWNYYEYDDVMTLARPEQAALRYPTGRRFFVSGYERGADELQGTAAAVAERYGTGRVVLFAGDPNFRAYTEGTQRVVWNAVLGGDPAPRSADVRARAADLAAAARSARAVGQPNGLTGRASVTVKAGAVDRALASVRGSGRTPSTTRLGGGLVRVTWSVPDEDGRAQLADVLERFDLRRSDVVTARVP